MHKLRNATLTLACAVALVFTVSHLSAQRAGGPAGPGGPAGRGAGAAQREEPIRHLVYIATPGDNGTDNQSGVVVLDADKNYSFLKRISYGLPAAQMPGPKNAGIAVSVPLQFAADAHLSSAVWWYNRAFAR